MLSFKIIVALIHDQCELPIFLRIYFETGRSGKDSQ